MSYADPCVERGATMACNPKAAAQAVKAVTELVTTIVKTSISAGR